MIYIHKIIQDEKAMIDTIDPTEIFEYYKEDSAKSQEYYQFLCMLKNYLEYFNNNTSTAFGNPDYSYMEGLVIGYCMAKHWDYNETKDYITILSSKGRKLIYIERPRKSLAEVNKQKELKQMWNEILG